MRILIVDDDALVARSLKVLLSAETDMEVVGVAFDGAHAVSACERHGPDAVLMDIRMSGMDGIEATRRIKALCPGIHVIMLTTFQDDRSVRLALQAGAEGYLLKSTPAAGMAEKLRAVASGSAVIDTEVFQRLIDPATGSPWNSRLGPQLRAKSRAEARPGLPDQSEPKKIPVEGLTLRETEVMELVAQGCSNKEIADRLFISEGTTRNVLSSVLDKLGFRDRTQLAIFYWRRTI
jgi:DNA-binding NarL/FixJ family response regulator